jgi:hypothetical protein
LRLPGFFPFAPDLAFGGSKGRVGGSSLFGRYTPSLRGLASGKVESKTMRQLMGQSFVGTEVRGIPKDLARQLGYSVPRTRRSSRSITIKGAGFGNIKDIQKMFNTKFSAKYGRVKVKRKKK